jgi:hypothetical protein
LASEGFWHLDSESIAGGSTEPGASSAQDASQQKAATSSAHLDAELFQLLEGNDAARRTLSELLLNTYFAVDVRELLRAVMTALDVSFWWVNQGSTYKHERSRSPRSGWRFRQFLGRWQSGAGSTASDTANRGSSDSATILWIVRTIDEHVLSTDT